ncbi:hypothetical protein MNEG_8512 [Monoraphidium neglectum]|uniref:Glycoside hydrolase family 5 domain-containing protein n=1 Tax=Monoraphidium neglectum TaxID=145388 RepID=A0A0D2JJF4_9CHLO|nr:hypothetical protein MNEG_8512 [Monoraphidium neglectum]KIY99452.1 hypothetical protein MNEG_8512 [Monoraphidium neglectum]|eukprot:XP_013898472.1 hypothetical protein MNEG_8512 [Monoraphidium neglectum]
MLATRVWFGFNNGQGAVDGLWAGGSDLATDFLEVVRLVSLLGFNAVRLPFRPLPPAPISIARPGGAKACNSYMPTGTGLDRLLWTVQVLNAHSLYVILDYHGSSGQALETDGVARADAFAARWADVWRAVACLPGWREDLAGRVAADILNEPDMLGLK